jgi:hypothetical protein
MARKNTVIIASVYPGELTATRPYGPNKGDGHKTFTLAPAAKDGYSVCEVEDCYQRVYHGESIGDKDVLVEARDIADDLVLNWTGHVIGTDAGFGPGVFVCQGDKPSQIELEGARLNQELYFEHLINQAEASFRANRFDEITDTHRKAAIWMGREGVEWLRPIRKVITKECPLCISQIPVKAVVCPNCRHQIGEIPKGMSKVSA